MKRVSVGCLALVWTASLTAFPLAGAEFPGPRPGRAEAKGRDGGLELANRVLRLTWEVRAGRLHPRALENRLTGETIPLGTGEAFELLTVPGRHLPASVFDLRGPPAWRRLEANRRAARLAERFAGRELTVPLRLPEAHLEADCRLVLRDEANAVRVELTLRALDQTVSLQSVRLVDLPPEGVEVGGTVPGSPLTRGSVFAACEHPDATSTVTNRAISEVVSAITLAPNQTLTLSAAFGAAPADQLRRSFLYYVERERAHPYRPFLHYNAWYDICWGDRKISEAECLQVIAEFGRELIQKRHVPLASFVWDDGWDDPRTLWRPVQTNFPHGFSRILARARTCGSTLGFWLSPFGGYGKPAEDRLAMGKARGFETGPQGFSLAGTNYHARFLDTCQRFITDSGANFFKFDGLARGVQETEAMLRLTRALRALKPDLFVSITTGTWPSPYWLWYGDSTWRGGGDMGFHGPGPRREQWITYRDLETYRRVARAAPLYPLNSLMNQGFALARYGTAQEVGTNVAEIRRELRSLFAGGTCLQELYVTPSLMPPESWDDLAECAAWAHRRADILVDTHWVGGDPGAGQVYGWASWSRRGGVVALRNPSPAPAAIELDLRQAFDLPPGAGARLVLKSPWASDRDQPALHLKADERRRFELSPFEVRVWDAVPE
jgi:hypothetical protein